MKRLRVLRGERIKQALEEDATYNELRQNIQRGFPETRKRQHATGEVNITNTKYVPIAGGLQVNAVSRSNGHNYAQTIIFSGVSNQAGEEGATYMGTDGEQHTIQPVPLQGSRVRVSCSCLDFHYRFANWNFSDGALAGAKPPLYQRKTANRPPVNPAQVSGVCKHLIKLVQELIRVGIVK
jgi:hypothetical protein